MLPSGTNENNQSVIDMGSVLIQNPEEFGQLPILNIYPDIQMKRRLEDF